MGIITAFAITGCLLYRKVSTRAQKRIDHYAGARPKFFRCDEVGASVAPVFNSPGSAVENEATSTGGIALTRLGGFTNRTSLSASGSAVTLHPAPCTGARGERGTATFIASSAVMTGPATVPITRTAGRIGGGLLQATSSNLSRNDYVLGRQYFQSYRRALVKIDRWRRPFPAMGEDTKQARVIRLTGSGEIHPIDGETFAVIHATGGANFLREARISRRPGTSRC
jgi:hypothetical protein